MSACQSLGGPLGRQQTQPCWHLPSFLQEGPLSTSAQGCPLGSGPCSVARSPVCAHHSLSTLRALPPAGWWPPRDPGGLCVPAQHNQGLPGFLSWAPAPRGHVGHFPHGDSSLSADSVPLLQQGTQQSCLGGGVQPDTSTCEGPGGLSADSEAAPSCVQGRGVPGQRGACPRLPLTDASAGVMYPGKCL